MPAKRILYLMHGGSPREMITSDLEICQFLSVLFLLLIRTIETCYPQGFTISPENYDNWKANNYSYTTKHRIGPRVIKCLISVQIISNETCLCFGRDL